MTITLVFLALLMGAIVFWLFRQSVNTQPWVATTGARDLDAAMLDRPAAKTALWVFLAVASSLFALFVSAYAMRIHFLDWTPLPQPRLLAVNTGILVLASIAMEVAVFAVRRRRIDLVRRALAAAGLLTAAFIVGQLVVWNQLADAGYFLTTSAATGFFYLLTAVHGLHVLGGLVAWVKSATRAFGDASPGKVRLGVELCATYWHFLLVVWIALFAVLVSSYLGLSICAPGASL
jgi:cytochrome c oxidase subunit 3